MNDITLTAIRIGTAVAIKTAKNISATRAAKRAEQELLDDSLMGKAIEANAEPIHVVSERLS